MKVLLENCSQNKEQWLKLKEGRIGSSQIGVVCGMSKHKTPLELWVEMTGKANPEKENDHMWFGSKIESTLGELFTRKRKIELSKPDILAVHPEKDWAIATPDFFTVPAESGAAAEIVETKTANYRQARYWEDGEVPVAYQIQLHWQLGICELPSGYVAGLVGGNPDDFYTPHYSLDRDLFELCMTEAEIFMELVRRDIPPAAGAGDSKLIAELQGVREDQVILLGEDAAPTIDEYQQWVDRKTELNKKIREIDDECDRLKGRILQLIGNKTAARLPDGRMISAKTTTVAERVQRGYSFVRVAVK